MIPHLLDVVDKDKLQDMQDSFCESLGCAGIITDSEGNYLTRTSRYSAFCNVVLKTPEGRKKCARCAASACKNLKSDQKPVSYQCHLDIVDCAAPIVFNGKLIGSFLVGQFVSSRVNANILRRKIKMLGIDPDQGLDLMNTLHTASDDKLSACMNLNRILCNLLTELTTKHFYYAKSEKKLTALKADTGSLTHQVSVIEKKPLSLGRNLSGMRREQHDSSSKSSSYASMDFIGKCSAIQNTIEIIKKIADIDIPILIQGETGTGKELVAKSIMRMSNRFDKPFIAVNCNSIPENLIESELFGHEKGAFTGSVGDAIGKFRLAHKGTIFLDEIGDVNIEFQKKILRALEEKCIVPIGGDNPIKVDFRLITATNQSLREHVAQGTFRRDLYHRICGVPIFLPPLRKRKDDIILLAQYFLDKFNAKLNKHLAFSEATKEFLKTQKWEGNIRELKNVIYRSVILNDCDLLQPENILTDSEMIHSENSPQLTELLEIYANKKIDIGFNFEKEMDIFQFVLIKEALTKSRNVISSASKLLGIPRTTLTGKLKKLSKTKNDAFVKSNFVIND